MASITDCVSEGLKYPFNDVKKLLSFGVLFAIVNIISFGIAEKSVVVFRQIARAHGDTLALKVTQIPTNDVYIIVALAIISFVISLAVMGYQYDVTKFSILKRQDLPGFGDITSILIKGIKYFAVNLAYNIIPMILFSLSVYLMSFESYAFYWLMIPAFMLFIICNFLLIMALSNMIDQDKFTKAFDLKEIVGKIANLGWVKYIGIILFTFIIYAIIMVAVGVIFMLISTFLALAIDQAMVISAIMTIIQGLFISSYLSVFFSRVYGSIYREAIK